MRDQPKRASSRSPASTYEFESVAPKIRRSKGRDRGPIRMGKRLIGVASTVTR
jgi:hypothetical protein